MFVNYRPRSRSLNTTSEVNDELIKILKEQIRSEINGELINPLKARIHSLELELHVNKLELAIKMDKQDAQIRNLQTRIMSLEEQAIFSYHLLKLHLRRVDDLEQYSRKVNLMLYEIEKFENNNPMKIMGYLEAEIG